MLNENIIRPSKSPYISPVWVVGKKAYNEDGTRKNRLVIDYKKLNDNTVPDRYPMPDPSIILYNLGKLRYFSTIDLESGFRQILIKTSKKRHFPSIMGNMNFFDCHLDWLMRQEYCKEQWITFYAKKLVKLVISILTT